MPRPWLGLSSLVLVMAIVFSATPRAMGDVSPSLELGSESVAVGEPLDVSGADFSPLSGVSLVLAPPDGGPDDGRDLGRTAVDESGDFDVTVVLPSDVADGTYAVIAFGVGNDGFPRESEATIDVAGGSAQAESAAGETAAAEEAAAESGSTPSTESEPSSVGLALLAFFSLLLMTVAALGWSRGRRGRRSKP